MKTDNPSRLPNFPRLILKISHQYLIMLNTSADKPRASVKLCFYRLCCGECSQTQPPGWLSCRKGPAQQLRAGPSANRTNQKQNSDSWRKLILLRDKLKICVVISTYLLYKLVGLLWYSSICPHRDSSAPEAAFLLPRHPSQSSRVS